ncbi:type I-E CRISPR-associated protein Cse1/CasA [Nguyenibacter vanlangensis]|uniref:Type I-E CRISPR-associated protein Cse1/CasA n=1 Tax=Nguyenibacter vanlangensis TaxID=1216886 RepID=A0A7Y7ITP6_9PROT|nr:type I-E CRISPR-associated protein Cse1/CasA [Nguyenibacter vanlangensis]NVN10115.1 type I-E CRISPR-associated protein Cse1/CasA [Nguyenibacter vanlangensis]
MHPSCLNLVTDPWLPVHRRSGMSATIRPAQIVEDIATDPVVAIDWPRADFRIASLEYVIGLLATACPPRDQDAWIERWEEPPSVAELDAAFAPVADAFRLDGPGPRFLQDMEDLQSDREPVERLLINAPGDSTVKKNADLFVHREQIAALGRPAAAMALFTLQSWAPSGGAGNMTGLRGGGPLVTLVLPHESANIWEIVWANTPIGSPVQEVDLPHVFPWLAPTIGSGKNGTSVRPGHNAHPLQCWWGMPRRIRLDFQAAEGGVCDLTGRRDDVLVTGWRQRPYGASYAGWTGMPYGAGAMIHPLTPRYRQKKDAEWLSVHPQPGGIGYRHWTGLVVNSGDGQRLPASAVLTWRDARFPDIAGTGRTRLLAAGYDMDNMKARGFVESEMPLPGATDPACQEALDTLARDCVEAADLVAALLRTYVRDALFGKGTVSPDAILLAGVREQFWTHTEGAFFDLVNRAARVAGQDDTGPDDTGLRKDWLRTIGWAAMTQFDATIVLAPDTGMTEAQRSAQARRQLRMAVAGSGKAGSAIMVALKIPVPVIRKPIARARRP